MKKIFLIIGLSWFTANAQSIERSVIASGGNAFKNTNYIVDWTIGETVIATGSSVNNLLSQGFHQSYINQSALTKTFIGGLSCYPNPTENYLQFSLLNGQSNAQITILDCNGTIALSETWNTQATCIMDISNLSAGIYNAQVKVGNSINIIRICKL